MSIVLIRVDNRLIHGQILEGWMPFTKATMIVVADNLAASNSFQKRVMEIAVPAEVKLKVEGVEDAVLDLKEDKFHDEKIMVIFSRLQDLVAAVRKGMFCSSINLGNLIYTSGKRQVTPSIALNDNDVDDLEALLRNGVHIDVRGVPRDKPAKIEKIIDSYRKACRRPG